MSDATCSHEGCTRDAKVKGFCRNHYQQAWARLNRGRRAKPCAIEGCAKPAHSRGWCNQHYLLWYRNGDPLVRKHNPPGSGNWMSNGYRQVVTPAGRRLEHHVVMEQILGRRLTPRENVHHVNGVRDDNRPENLELWCKPQPQGQRVADLVAWVVENSPAEVAAALAG